MQHLFWAFLHHTNFSGKAFAIKGFGDFYFSKNGACFFYFFIGAFWLKCFAIKGLGKLPMFVGIKNVTP